MAETVRNGDTRRTPSRQRTQGLGAAHHRLSVLLVLLHRGGQAGTARMKYAPNVDIIKLMCSGRIDPELITTAFANGRRRRAWCCGCHIGDCHYMSGNHKTMVRMPLSAARAGRPGHRAGALPPRMGQRGRRREVQKLVTEMTEQVRGAGPAGLAGADAHARGGPRAGPQALGGGVAHERRQRQRRKKKVGDVLGRQLRRVRHLAAGDRRRGSST